MASAHWVSHTVDVAAKLDIAGRLATGPKTADELAGPTHTHAPSLYRLTRVIPPPPPASIVEAVLA